MSRFVRSRANADRADKTRISRFLFATAVVLASIVSTSHARESDEALQRGMRRTSGQVQSALARAVRILSTRSRHNDRFASMSSDVIGPGPLPAAQFTTNAKQA